LFSSGCINEQRTSEDITEQMQQKEEAKELVGFDVLISSYIPEGYEFKRTLFFNNSTYSVTDQIYEMVTFVYENDDEWIHVSEICYETDYSRMDELDNAEKVSINGSEAKFVAFTQSNFLRWETGDIEFTIVGMASKDDIVKMAESMR
jgi:hypothetical protein